MIIGVTYGNAFSNEPENFHRSRDIGTTTKIILFVPLLAIVQIAYFSQMTLKMSDFINGNLCNYPSGCFGIITTPL